MPETKVQSPRWKGKFDAAVQRTYAGQAKYWLNAFWLEGAEQEAENIWKFTQKMIELDPKKKKEGNELDEWHAHQFLEQIKDVHTVIDLREKLRKMDIDCNKRVALLEFLLFHYGKDVSVLVNKPQGDSKEIEEAEARVKDVLAKLADLQQKLQEQKAAVVRQKAAVEAQKQAVEAQKLAAEKQKQLELAAAEAVVKQRAAEEELAKAEAAMRAALEDVLSQEKAFKSQCEKLEKLSKDDQVGAVAKNKAAAELAQLKCKDPLPLQRAKITQQAAVKRVERERKVAADASVKAEADRVAAVAARAAAEEKARQLEEKKRQLEEETRQLEEQTRQVEKSLQETEVAFEEASKALEEAKQHGVNHGDVWWLERELAEARKYMPQSMQARK